MTTTQLTFDAIAAAHTRIAAGLRPTACAHSAPLSTLAGMMIWLKHDYAQATGSFKERGARHALLCLTPEQRTRGVVAASAGNHALGLAWHGRELGIDVTVVMPRQAPRVKAGRCHALGAHVVLHGNTFDEAAAHARALVETTGKTLVHPYDDLAVMAGQGTLALEILYAVPDLDAIVVPVGGGGLLAGTVVAAKALRPNLRVIGVEPVHAAGFVAARQAGRPVRTTPLPTLADGLAVATAGTLPFTNANPLVDELLTVSEDELAHALLVAHETHDLVLEGAGVAALAAVLSGRLAHLTGQRVAVPLTGRNIDPSPHARALHRARYERTTLAIV